MMKKLNKNDKLNYIILNFYRDYNIIKYLFNYMNYYYHLLNSVLSLILLNEKILYNQRVISKAGH